MKKIFLFFLLLSTTVFANSEAILKLDTQGHTGIINDLLVSKDKSEIISASDDKTIRVWDIQTGKEKKKILGSIGTGPEGMIYAIALSGDNKYLAVGGLFADPNDAIRIYNYKTGKLLKVLESHTNTVYDLSFSSDDKYLISGSGDKTVKIWQTSNWTLENTINYHTDFVYAVKMIKREHSYDIYSAGYDNKIVLHQFYNNNVRYINSYTSNDKLAYLATNGTDVATCGYGHEILIFDNKLNLKQTIKSTTVPTGLAYSPDGESLAAGTSEPPYDLNIYETNSYKTTATFIEHTNLTMAVNFIDNDTVVSGGGENNEIYIWDKKNAIKIKKVIGVGECLWSVGIKGDEIAWGNEYCDDVNCQNLKKSINLKDFQIKPRIDSLFRSIPTTNGDWSLEHKQGGEYGYDAVLEIKKDGVVKNNIEKDPNTGYRHNCYGWYKDFIISGGMTGFLKIYNKKGEEIASLVGHTGEIESIAIDGDRLVSGSSDQTIKVWDLSVLNDANKPLEINEEYVSSIMDSYKISRENVLAQARKLNDTEIYLKQKIYPTITLFISHDNEYVVYTDEGFFTASKNGGQYIGYHINQGPYKEAEYVTVDALYSTFYRPDLIQKALAGESLEKYAKNINIDKLLEDGLAPEVHILTSTTNTDMQDLALKVEVCPKANGGYDNLTLLINDMPVSVIDTSRALKLKKKSERDDCFNYDQTISLAGGKNTIGFRATNKAGNIESKPDFLEVTFDDTNLKKKVRSKLEQISGSQNVNDLHILAIAVNEYKDKDLTLKYSINDAKEMLKTIQDVAKPLFKKVHTYKLFDKEVTKENIIQAFKDINSTREDVFLLYIAGHGITDEYNGNYYYIPYNFEDKDNTSAVQVQGVGQKDLMLGLSRVTALKSLVLLDTCNSGSFVEANMQKTTTNKLARATGRATISASSKSQVALEGYEGHGVFTYTLIEALKGMGYNQDNTITINGLNDYVEETLPDRTEKKWGYRQIPQSSMYGVDFTIGAIK